MFYLKLILYYLRHPVQLLKGLWRKVKRIPPVHAAGVTAKGMLHATRTETRVGELEQEKSVIEAENREAFENGTNFKPEEPIELPYKTPAELHDKMAEYFDLCKGGDNDDWKGILEEFATLAQTMKEHPTWSNHRSSYERIAAKLRSEGVFPDEAGMRMYLGLTHEMYKAYKDDRTFEAVFNWAQDMRESWAARRLAAEPRAAQAYLNILKQSSNGGWVDRKAEKADNTLHVKIAGVGGEEAFL